MPLRDLLVSDALIIAILPILFIGRALGSEYDVSLPSRRGFSEPAASPWLLAFLRAVAIGIIFLSRRDFAILFMALPILMLWGLPVGTLFFDSIPGSAQHLLILFLGAGGVFIWPHDHLNED